jgi:hypothetical protein
MALVPGGRALAGAIVVALAWIVCSLVWHPGFQPAPLWRTAAPIVALAIGAGFTRLVAQARSGADAEREFDRGGKALFMGFVMVGATAVAWLLVSQAVPATLNALVGGVDTESGVVARRVPPTADASCRFRLEVASVASTNGGVQRPLDECVAEPVWTAARDGSPVALRLVRSVFGAELVDVGAP